MFRKPRPAGRYTLVLGAAWVLALLLAAAPAWATRLIKPGEPVDLRPGEGLLLVSIDTDYELASVRFRRDGAILGGGTFRSLEKGRTTRLYAVPGGRYHWTRVTRLDTWIYTNWVDVGDDEDFAFEVKPGKVNYPGDLVYRGGAFSTSQLRLANRGLAALDWLRAKHPSTPAGYGFAYSGRYPDPFPELYAARRNGDARSDTELDAVTAPAKPATPLPLAPRDLWKDARIDDVSLSQDGRLLAQALREGEDKWALDVFDIARGTNVRVLVSDMSFDHVQWESERILLATMHSPLGDWLQVLHIELPEAGPLKARRVAGPVGDLVDLLPNEPGVVLYQRRDDRGQLSVHRLDLTDEKTVREFKGARISERLNAGVSDDLQWLTDGQGRLRLYFKRRPKPGDEDENEIVAMHGVAGRFREAMVVDPSKFMPLQLSFDGERLYGFTDEGRGQRDLVEFDLATGRMGRTVHSRPGVDLRGAVLDERREPVAVLYYRDGRLVTDYFDAKNQRLSEMLRRAFPNRSVLTLERSRDGNVRVLMVDGIDQPPQLYLLDVAKGSAGLLDDYYPGLADRRFAPADVLKVDRGDGVELDAFLTRPTGSGPRPLIVMAHGGPIGVKDDLHFNREVQFLASLGYAVLQVNFRGSEGYGRAFREAGHRNYGRLIEDDIDAAIRAAVARYPIDESRMCTLGSSYGGYSAMVSAIRWPGRFRCAVSISGVSDRALFFTASDSVAAGDAMRDTVVRIMGDPNVAADLDDMRATSPLYRAADLVVPLMLVHGREDARVDFEHSRRMVRMLNLAGRKPVGLFFDREGHGFEKIDNIEATWSGIAAFLAQHLAPPAAPTTTSSAK
ncbi:alpha/beta hydrolase family protein [Lysobacter humi (ex Lee et al. 2017)]